MSDTGTFDTSIRAWLSAMQKAKRIKSGGKLVFINKRTGTVVPMREQVSADNLMNNKAGVTAEPIEQMREQGASLGKKGIA